MKVNIFATHNLHEEFKGLLAYGWLGEYDGITYDSHSSISKCIVMGAYSPSKIFDIFEDTPKRVVLVEGNLSNWVPFRKSTDGSITVFSIEKGYQPDDLMRLIKAIEILYLGESRCSTSSCLFSSSFLSTFTDICEECQSELVSAGMINNVVRILAITCLQKREISFSKYSLKHIGNAVRDLGISSRHPSITVGATDLVIDAMACPGSSVREWLSKTSIQIQDEKAAIKDRYASTLPKTSITSPVFLASRRWNSWTPNQPIHESSRALHFKTGGGYFLCDGKTSIAIDPGYGYLDMLFEHGITVMDIDSVVITHDHPDHLAELQNILGLRYNYRKDCTQLSLYLNPSSYFLLNNFAKYYNQILQDGKAVPLFPDTEIKIGSILLSSIGMYHDEIYDFLGDLKKEVIEEVGPSKALGLKLVFEDQGNNKLTCAIPGDTSFPKTPEECKRLLAFYGRPDIAAIHLGSLEDDWTNLTNSASRIEYGENKHLGINGVIHFLRLLEPKVAVLTEFGEELDAKLVRFSIVELVKQALTATPTKILPSDLNLFLAFYNGETFCKCECTDFVPAKYIDYRYRENRITYEFSAGCESGLHHTLESELQPLLKHKV